MTNYVRQMLNDAAEAGYLFLVLSDGERDYAGGHPALAEDAISAVEEAELVLINPATTKRAGWAKIVNGLDDDERIANTGADDWCGKWASEHIQ